LQSEQYPELSSASYVGHMSIETLMSKKRDRWDFWVDLIIPIGAALLLFLTLSSIFSDRHHAGEATRIAPGTNQLGAH